VSFWKIVWENNVKVIVMLTKFIERRRVKAHCYWPSANCPETFDDITVELVSESTSQNHKSIKIQEFRMRKQDEVRTVVHLHFTEWPDFGVPESTSGFRQLLEMTEVYRDNGGKPHSPDSAPVLVHCSAGIGRSGTFLAISIFRELFGTCDVEIFDIVNALREQRMGMVQCVEQYQFIYQFVGEESQSKLYSSSPAVKSLRSSCNDKLRSSHAALSVSYNSCAC